MSYAGDIRLGDTIDVKFTTRRFSTGAPFTLAGSPVISAYVGNGTTEITAGITLTVDFDSRTGLNNVRVVASGANGFATATNVQLVITTGTVDSVSVVGEVVGSFSIENRSAVMPTTAGRTLDVSLTGEAGVDWANVGTPGSTVSLSATTVNLVNTATTLTNLPAITANWLTAAGIAAAALNGKGDWATVNPTNLTAAQIATGVWQDTTAGDFTVALSIGKSVMNGVALGTGLTINAYTGNTAQTGDSFARIGAAGASLTDLGGMSTTMKAQVQTEAEDALVVHRLDELLNADSDIDGAAPPTVGSVFHELMTKTVGSFTFDQTTDSLEALRDRGDAAWITATGFSTHTAADVWASATRLLTAGTNIVLAKGTGITGFNDLSAAQVNAEVDAALATDTYAEPTGAPAATASLEKKLAFLYEALRNKLTVTATSKAFFNDAGTSQWSKALSDDGTTYTEAEGA